MTSVADIALKIAGPAGARPLVLLHGIGSNARSFRPLMAELATDRRVVAWDAPGYGGSAPLPQEWPSADDYADALLAVLDWLGFETPDVLGHSMGALIAGRFAVRNPKRLRRLVLASPALGYGTRRGEPLARAAGSRLEAMIAEGGERFAASRAARLVHRRGDAALVAEVTRAMSEVKLPGYQQSSRMLSCADLVADAGAIATPTLVLVGAEDEITPPSNCRRTFDALLAATPALGHRFELVASAGHAVVQEQPAAVAALLRDALS